DCPGLAHIRRDGSLDEEWCPRPNGSVSTLLHVGSVLYVGGDFPRIDGVAREGAAALETEAGRASDSRPPTASAASSPVVARALAVAGSSVCIGGISPGRDASALLIEVDNRSGQRTAWKPSFAFEAASRYIPGVGALALGDGVIYVGGVGLTRMGGARRENLA